MRIRPPAVAGMFYPADEQELTTTVSSLLQQVPRPERYAKAIIAPHAGYIYSGPTAAFAYKVLNPDAVRSVILLGPAHRVPFYGLALPNAEYFDTPLGHIPLDRDAMQRALAMPGVEMFDAAHVNEHSLEVHLPFLQSVLGEFRLLPFCVGMAKESEVARIIDAFWDGEETAIVISSDLSHYHSYDEARQIDQATIDTILEASGPLNHEQACGATPINGLLELTGRYGMQAELLNYQNSGDTAGDKDRVVGYASVGFFHDD